MSVKDATQEFESLHPEGTLVENVPKSRFQGTATMSAATIDRRQKTG
jgi:hypothetical protein